MFQTWDLSKKKWLYWIGMIGFIGTVQWYLWLIGLVFYLIFDREKGKTENYQIDKAWMKFGIVAGIGILIILIFGSMMVIAASS